MIETTYCGRKESDRGTQFTLLRNGRPWLPACDFQQEEWLAIGPDWGNCSKGARKLAYCLLLDALKSKRAAQRWYVEFTNEILRNLGREWWLSATDLRDWHAHATASSTIERGMNGQTET